MPINRIKTKCMLFNKVKKYDFILELCLSEDARLEVVESMTPLAWSKAGFPPVTSLSWSTEMSWIHVMALASD